MADAAVPKEVFPTGTRVREEEDHKFPNSIKGTLAKIDPQLGTHNVTPAINTPIKYENPLLVMNANAKNASQLESQKANKMHEPASYGADNSFEQILPESVARFAKQTVADIMGDKLPDLVTDAGFFHKVHSEKNNPDNTEKPAWEKKEESGGVIDNILEWFHTPWGKAA